MAAKQGLTAQLSQAGEDARRAVLSRTTLTASSWFANLNTVCTIKSAPPRSPDVLNMLATKSGWLYKRNEQHVWQARWCCVVPHMFLYYFDATATADAAAAVAGVAHGGTEPAVPQPLQPTPQQQEDWNRAVQRGYNHKRPQEKRSNFYLFPSSQLAATEEGDGDENDGDDPDDGHGKESKDDRAYPSGGPDLPPFAADPDGTGASPFYGGSTKFTSLQPAGIIDLECYTRVNRSSANPRVLELAGDDAVNPDLRAFYFCAHAPDEADDWSDALLHHRHAALQDECDAYKQVCEGFAAQLQQLHAQLDAQARALEEAQEELYRVRSSNEDVRRTCWGMLQDVADGHGGGAAASPSEGGSGAAAVVPASAAATAAFRGHLDRARRQDMGVATAVQLLCDYARALHGQNAQLGQETEQLQAELRQSGQTDQQELEQIQRQLEQLQVQYQSEAAGWESQRHALTAQYEEAQKQLQDVQKELGSTRMEMTMYQGQQKNKVNLLLEHKRILKKEVIELRTKLDNALSEVTSLKQEQTSHAVVAQQEREKNKLLERYVEKIESQVKVQQNMMEIMSHSVAGSVYGGDHSVVGSVRNGIPPVAEFKRNLFIHDQEDDDDEEEEDDDAIPEHAEVEDADGNELDKISPIRKTRTKRVLHVEDDAKSHMSELTEDRTQRHLEGLSPYHRSDPSPRPFHRKQLTPSSRRPPYVIGGSPPTGRTPRRQLNHGQDGSDKKNKSTSARSLPPCPNSAKKSNASRGKNEHDGSSTSSDQKLSVAQKARRDADERQSSPVPVWVDEQTEASLKKKKMFGFGSNNKKETISSNNSQGSGLWRHVEEAFLGPRSEDELSDDAEPSGSQSVGSDESGSNSRDSDSEDSKKRSKVNEKRVDKRTKPERTQETDSQSSVGLSIQQRAQLQRAKQLEFLKQQGLIKSEKDVSGGAGAEPRVSR